VFNRDEAVGRGGLTPLAPTRLTPPPWVRVADPIATVGVESRPLPCPVGCSMLDS
jgi:hypothetical protein